MPSDPKPNLRPTPADQARDQKRLARSEDERLSRKAGYGRADSTPGKPGGENS